MPLLASAQQKPDTYDAQKKPKPQAMTFLILPCKIFASSFKTNTPSIRFIAGIIDIPTGDEKL